MAGLSAPDLRAEQLGINDSVTAMGDGEIDAFFWSGGVPTEGVRARRALPIRLLDLSDVVGAVRARFPVYASGTCRPARTGSPTRSPPCWCATSCWSAAAMPDDLAEALVAALFAAQEGLAQASPAALTIDPRAAIGTQPVPLHPGAERFYRTRTAI